MKIPDNLFHNAGRVLLSGVPEGLDARVIAEIISTHPARTMLHVALDDKRLAALAEALGFFAPDIEVLRFPAWDCLPYDRVSPHADMASERMDTLCRLAAGGQGGGVRIVLATVNAALQRVPPRDVLKDAIFEVARGESLDVDALTGFLTRNGYSRTGTVREPGECALRGGIIDVFPPGTAEPVRLDLFGDEVERIRLFDPATQRSGDDRETVRFEPVSEILLDEASIARFRAGYREAFGSVTDDPLYVAVSEGRKQIGMEHWLPLFHERMETLFDYLPEAPVTLDHQADEAVSARFETIDEYFEARQSFLATANRRSDDETAPVYRPLPPDRLYFTAPEWRARLGERAVGQVSPFAAPGSAAEGYAQSIDAGGRRGHDFSAVRAESRRISGPEAPDNVFETVRGHLEAQISREKHTAIACFTNGARERLGVLLGDHGVRGLAPVESWAELESLPAGAVGLAVLGLEHGFTSSDAAFISEQDILGERLVRPTRRRSQAEQFIADAGELSAGDLVVHVEHGIGRYEGLETLSVSNAPHDCLKITYDGGDRLFVPVENVEVLSRYGSGEASVALDRLGGAAWQSRKSKLKQRLRDMADELIRIAAARTLQPAPRMTPAPGHFEEFCARFPYDETEDQHRAIGDTMEDLQSGRPMDRLVCGDVGFGKTEVALRAAFATVMEGGQVAVVVPTTLLSRQHFATFTERFAGEPVRIAQLSRLVSTSQMAEIRAGMASGEVDIVIGTHALLGNNIEFKNLVLLVVDEEQHFGVTHKERLKKLRADVHVLTLTATPIPRTLQMALAGVKDMSMIATPPVDRLAVRTFVTPFDPVVIREAIMREHFRGGQIFFVCPRISDLDAVAKQVREIAPDVKLAMAHGRMPARALEEVMTAFYDGRIDLLLSTQIVESGLDIPTANTLIVHRADMFGLAQLYQLRGRIGRSKLRAYCYLTIPSKGILSASASKRLEVMQSLDSLGAGFTLASHDLDIRGAGNLLGDEQSGHIREVGVELYQHMLEEAVAMARGAEAPSSDTEWSPQINIGTPVLIPEGYVQDLDVRLGLYRRVATLEDPAEIDSFAAEMIDRFGPLPDEVENLLKIVAIKRLCRAAGVGKLDAGPKGAVVTFHDETFANPVGLVEYISREAGKVSLRPDHRLVYRRDWTDAVRRLKGAHELLQKLADIAA